MSETRREHGLGEGGAADRDERYLWDRSGPVDPDVEGLERLLGRFGARRGVGVGGRTVPAGSPPPDPAAGADSVAHGHRPFPIWIASAAAFVIGISLLVTVVVTSRGSDVADLRELARGTWITATGGERRLVLGEDAAQTVDLTLRPGSRLQVRHVDEQIADLFLAGGELEAFVLARARFFQVETPSARCVDLGCRYVLRVEDDGSSHVHVTTGQVSFENPDGSEVFVPAGAECRATRGALGTPRFRAAPATLHAAVEAYDRAPPGAAQRTELARAIAAAATDARDSLTLWHVLRDGDARGELELVEVARQALTELLGPPDRDPAAPDADVAELWRAHAEPRWF